MPHIEISLYSGRDAQTKQDLAKKVADFFAQELKFPEETVSVSFMEIEKAIFDEEMAKRIDRNNLVIASNHVK